MVLGICCGLNFGDFVGIFYAKAFYGKWDFCENILRKKAAKFCGKNRVN
jgi:hypothetical protein